MKSLCAAFALAALLTTLLPAQAATTGIAYDSVTKFGSADAASLQPGNFDADFQTASQPPQEPKRGGLLGGLNAAISQGMAAGAMFRTGLAERHYVAGSKQRVDNVASQTATILDCQARTIATLDLKNKTYTLVSLDAPQPATGGSRSGPSAPQAIATDDGSKVAITTSNRALGTRQIGPDSTDGYQSDMMMTVTRADGQSSTSQMSKTEYLTKMGDISLTCASLVSNAPGPSAAAMSQYATLNRAMNTKNPRFTVSGSGPPIPGGRFSVYTLLTMSGGAGGSGPSGAKFAMLLERGHERSIMSDDPVFSIPSDFTKTN